ncbi:MAG: Rho termination factor N-terminal domain-containing protein, partial [Actinomycetota bacterium]|nr:Rho termination factor N-terminal domain-containing protein [Actinomycetota bacterium]
MVLAELRQLAGELNIAGTAGMRKGELITAIKDRQGGGVKTRATASADSPGGQLRLDNAGEPRPQESASSDAVSAPAEVGDAPLGRGVQHRSREVALG